MKEDLSMRNGLKNKKDRFLKPNSKMLVEIKTKVIILNQIIKCHPKLMTKINIRNSSLIQEEIHNKVLIKCSSSPLQ
jgi:hypothetical protein